jgi:hypothetical protein
LQGESVLNLELVSRLIISLTWWRVSIENRLNLYSNYLDNPQNVDIDYQMHLVMKINKYLSANVALQTIYDDNSIQAVQLSEVLNWRELWFLETNKISLLKKSFWNLSKGLLVLDIDMTKILNSNFIYHGRLLPHFI